MENTTATDNLLLALRERQQADHLSDSALARKLRVSKALLSLVLGGKTEPSLLLLRGIMREYPTLQPYVTLFLQSESRILDGRKQVPELEASR